MKYLIVALLFVACLSQLEQMEAILSNLPRKYCPMRGFNGQPYCPVKTEETMKEDANIPTIHLDEFPKQFGDISFDTIEQSSFTENKTEIKVIPMSNLNEPISGFGYDRVKREMKFPILPSNSKQASPKTDHSVLNFKQVSEYLTHVFKQSEWKEGGLYVRNNAALLEMANNFGDYKVNIGITQRHYTTFTTTLKSQTPLEEFQEIVNSLPAWNPNSPQVREIYSMLIHYFGTDITATTLHGGVVYQQVAVKSCFGGSITEGMLKDIDHFIRRIPPGPTAYAKFRRLGQTNILGGNPELGADKINERIASFGVAPAPIKFQTIPIYNVIPDANRKAWVKAAIDTYVAENQPNVNKIISDINVKRENAFRGPQKLYFMDYHIAQKTNWVVYWTGCALIRLRGGFYTPHCTLLRNPVAMAASQKQNTGGVFYETQAIVERKPTGEVGIYSVFRGQIRHPSPHTRSGCVRANYGPRLCQGRLGCIDTWTRLFKYVCINCLPVIRQQGGGEYNTIHTFPECHCENF